MVLASAWTAPQAQPLEVVATTPSLGMLARAVGGDQVRVRVLAPDDRDPHYLDARPSYMAAVRRADLLLEMGAGLEEGWLPAVLSGAANPAVNEGRRGHFRASDTLSLRRSVTMDGPNVGHVHAEGNPHFNIDPLRMAVLADALAKRMGQLRTEKADYFLARSEDAAQRLRQHARALADRIPADRQFVAYHEDLDYLEEWLPVKVLGYLEPVPGVPPTARHLRRLVRDLEGREGRVLHARYQPSRGAGFLQRHLGWDIHAVSLEPPVDADLEGYLELMSQWAAVFGGG
ncbi:metal ABC transporter substrate-binding protein [Thioalkalivibrio denitrificans]|nr:metal ABC transporter substrate-binding protein [Thioalkalivibrio denitrificans]